MAEQIDMTYRAEHTNQLLLFHGYHAIEWSKHQQKFLITQEELRDISRLKDPLGFSLFTADDYGRLYIDGLSYRIRDYSNLPTTAHVMADTLEHG